MLPCPSSDGHTYMFTKVCRDEHYTPFCSHCLSISVSRYGLQVLVLEKDLYQQFRQRKEIVKELAAVLLSLSTLQKSNLRSHNSLISLFFHVDFELFLMETLCTYFNTSIQKQKKSWILCYFLTHSSAKIRRLDQRLVSQKYIGKVCRLPSSSQQILRLQQKQKDNTKHLAQLKVPFSKLLSFLSFSFAGRFFTFAGLKKNSCFCKLVNDASRQQQAKQKPGKKVASFKFRRARNSFRLGLVPLLHSF